MLVLVACEFSGVVRRAFAARGHKAWSCDIIDTEDGDPMHLKMDVRDAIGLFAWDLMIAHPPCTYLSNSGAKHLYKNMKKENGPNPERWRELDAGVAFFRELWCAKVPRIAIENPIMLGYAKTLIGCGKQTQTIHPWQFGHGETKATCLWLRNLPKLTPTDIVDGRTPRVHFASPSPDRWKERSRTLEGIANAMADQWGIIAV